MKDSTFRWAVCIMLYCIFLNTCSTSKVIRNPELEQLKAIRELLEKLPVRS